MSPVQKVIKYCAMAFAITLIVSILTVITAIVSGIDKGINWDGKIEYIDINKEFTDVQNLDITNYSGKMFIQVGDVDKIQVKAEKVPDTTVVKMKDNDTLYIDDTGTSIWFFNFNFFDSDYRDKSQITVTLPLDFIAKEVQLDNNSGKIELKGVDTDRLLISGGSGNIIGSNLKAEHVDLCLNSGAFELDNVDFNDGDIDGGSGAMLMTNSLLESIEFDLGSGALHLEGSLTGKSEISGGSGRVLLNLIDPIDNYELELDEGSGGIWVNGEREDDEDIRNKDADNELKVKGGSGKVNINFAE